MDSDLLALFDQIIEETSAKLKALGDLHTVTERQLAIGEAIDFPRAP